MTKNVIELSRLVLAKFADNHNRPVAGQISKPADLASEIAALKRLEGGQAWVSPSGVGVCDFRQDGIQCLALTLVLQAEELAELADASGGSIQPIEVPGSVFLYLADRLNLTPIKQIHCGLRSTLRGLLRVMVA